VAQMTGTPVRTTIATGSATATTLAEYVMALTQDLQARGIIK
jgi:sulfur transfer complex TusBCD TusB component (DsrH family)